jgi:hypothetical protein
VGAKDGEEEWEQWPEEGEDQQAGGDAGFRPTTADLHWDLVMEGLTPMKGGQAEGEGLNPGMIGAADGEAGQRTRELIAAQEAAAAAVGVGGVGGRAPTTAALAAAAGVVRDGASQATMLSMMAKAARKHQQQQQGMRGQGSPGVLGEKAASNDAGRLFKWLDDMASQGAGAKKYGYEWARLFEVMREGGWVPQVGGGGGKHFKFKRQLPASGKVQVLTMPCTPSDVLRSVKCAASSVARRDHEAWELEGKALGVLPAE